MTSDRAATVARLANAINDWHRSGESHNVHWIPPEAAALLAQFLVQRHGARLDAAGGREPPSIREIADWLRAHDLRVVAASPPIEFNCGEPPEEIVHIDEQGRVVKSTVLNNPEREGPCLPEAAPAPCCPSCQAVRKAAERFLHTTSRRKLNIPQDDLAAALKEADDSRAELELVLNQPCAGRAGLPPKEEA